MLTYAFQGWNKQRCRKGRREIKWRNREGGLRNMTGDLKTHNELSATQDSLFPSMKTTSFHLRMFSPVFCKVILKKSSGRGELT